MTVLVAVMRRGLGLRLPPVAIVLVVLVIIMIIRVGVLLTSLEWNGAP
jgi:hypothetical protein